MHYSAFSDLLRLLTCIAFRPTTKMPRWTTLHNFLKAAELPASFDISSIAISPLQLTGKSSSPPSADIFGQSGLETYLTL